MNVLIVFGSECGTTRYVARVIKETLVEKNHTVTVFDANEQKNHPEIEEYDVLLFGSPTYNGGQLETKMAELVSSFSPNLSGYKVAVFSLGDSNYRHFCASAELLEQWVTQNDGELAQPALKIDGYPENTDEIKKWVNQVIAK